MTEVIDPRPMEPSTCIEAEPYALRVIDDSMEPEFKRGCIIIIDPTGRVRDGAFVLAEQDDGFIFRRLDLDGESVQLAPLNPSYEPIACAGGLDAVKGIIIQRAGARRSYHKRYE